MKTKITFFLLLIAHLGFAQTLSTYAGTGAVGLVNGPANQATFSGGIEQIATDANGNLYICDSANNVIRKIDEMGIVTTFAGTGIIGDLDGPRETARFNKPYGIAVDSEGNIFFSDNLNEKIKVILPNGMIEVAAGSGIVGYNDGPADQAQFFNLTYLCVDSFGDVYGADVDNVRIRKLNRTTNMVSTVAGNGFWGYSNGQGTSASFNLPIGMTIDNQNNIYVGDRDNNVIRKITPDNYVSLAAGGTAGGYADGNIFQARFNQPKGVAIDPQGNIYVADRLNFVIRKIDTNNQVTTVAGIPGVSGYQDGDVSVATIGRPVDIVWHPDNFLLINDYTNNVIRKLTVDTTVVSNVVSLSNNNEINVTPNPASDFLNVSGDLGDQFQIRLKNLNGQTLLSLSNKKKIEVSDLPHGLYFLEISGTDYRYVERVLIE